MSVNRNPSETCTNCVRSDIQWVDRGESECRKHLDRPIVLVRDRPFTFTLLARARERIDLTFGVWQDHNEIPGSDFMGTVGLSTDWTLLRSSFVASRDDDDARIFLECIAKDADIELACLGIDVAENTALEQVALQWLGAGRVESSRMRIRLRTFMNFKESPPDEELASASANEESQGSWRHSIFDLEQDDSATRRFRLVLGNGDYHASFHPPRRGSWVPPFLGLFLLNDNRAEILSLPFQPGIARIELYRTSGSEPNQVNFVARTVAIHEGQRHSVSFHARADNPRRIVFLVQMARKPWSLVAKNAYRVLELGREWREFYFEFVSDVTADDARVSFYLGGSAISVELAKIQVLHLLDEWNAPADTLHSSSGPG